MKKRQCRDAACHVSDRQGEQTSVTPFPSCRQEGWRVATGWWAINQLIISTTPPFRAPLLPEGGELVTLDTPVVHRHACKAQSGCKPMAESHLPQPVASERSERRIGLTGRNTCALKGQYTTNQYITSYAAPTGRMENTSGNPMRRSLRSLATGWVKCPTGIGFQPVWGFQPCIHTYIF
jgi:hypothetical protein